MATDSGLDELSRGYVGNRRKRIFNPEINLGHILSFAGAILAGFMAFNTLDKKQAIAEAKIAVVEERMREQELRNKEALIELKADVKTVQRTLDDIKSSVGRSNK